MSEGDLELAAEKLGQHCERKVGLVGRDEVTGTLDRRKGECAATRVRPPPGRGGSGGHFVRDRVPERRRRPEGDKYSYYYYEMKTIIKNSNEHGRGGIRLSTVV